MVFTEADPPIGEGRFVLRYQWSFPPGALVAVMDQGQGNLDLASPIVSRHLYDESIGVYLEIYERDRKGSRPGWAIKLYVDMNKTPAHQALDRIAAIGLTYDTRMSTTGDKDMAITMGHLSVTSAIEPLRFITGRRYLPDRVLPFEALSFNLNFVFKVDTSVGRFDLSKYRVSTRDEGQILFHKYKAVLFVDLALRPLAAPSEFDLKYIEQAIGHLKRANEYDAPHRRELVKYLRTAESD